MAPASASVDRRDRRPQLRSAHRYTEGTPSHAPLGEEHSLSLLQCPAKWDQGRSHRTWPRGRLSEVPRAAGAQAALR